MKRTFLVELHKAICNRYFVITLIIGVLITLFSAGVRIELFFEHENIVNTLTVSESGEISKDPMLGAFSLYNNWVGAEGSSIGHSAFYLLLPMLASLPFSWSWCSEHKSGYELQMIIRTKKRYYHMSKYLVTFLSGMVAIVVPLIINIISVALFIPARTPDPYYDLYYGMSKIALFSELFYSIPVLYMLIYVLMAGIFGGLFAVLALSFSYVVRNRFAVIGFPFLIALVLHYISFVFAGSLGKSVGEISPVWFLSALNSHLEKNMISVSLIGGAIFVISFLLSWKQGGKGDAL